MIGTPGENDTAFIKDKVVLAEVEAFEHQKRIELSERYPGSSADALDFLDRILQFNPYKRLTLKDAFDHPLFTGFEKPLEQKGQMSQTLPIIPPLASPDLTSE